MSFEKIYDHPITSELNRFTLNSASNWIRIFIESSWRKFVSFFVTLSSIWTKFDRPFGHFLFSLTFQDLKIKESFANVFKDGK